MLDATGNPKVQENAIYPLRRGGALTLVGVAPHDAKVTFDTFRMHHQETRVLALASGFVISLKWRQIENPITK